MTAPAPNASRIEELITFVLKLTADPAMAISAVSRTRLMKYIFIGDLAHADWRLGETYTGADWQFLHFGPWAAAVQDVVGPSIEKLGVIKIPYRPDDEDVSETMLWSGKGISLPEVKPPVAVQLAIERAVREHRTTAELLHYVYRTRPMLRAAPGEHLDFSVDARPSDQRTATPGSPTTRQLRKRRERLEQARMRIQAARESRAEPKWVEVIPVYDDEFARVAAVLEASNGDAPEPFDAEATFDESVWKSGVRGDDIP